MQVFRGADTAFWNPRKLHSWIQLYRFQRYLVQPTVHLLSSQQQSTSSSLSSRFPTFTGCLSTPYRSLASPFSTAFLPSAPILLLRLVLYLSHLPSRPRHAGKPPPPSRRAKQIAKYPQVVDFTRVCIVDSALSYASRRIPCRADCKSATGSNDRWTFQWFKATVNFLTRSCATSRVPESPLSRLQDRKRSRWIYTRTVNKFIHREECGTSSEEWERKHRGTTGRSRRSTKYRLSKDFFFWTNTSTLCNGLDGKVTETW